MIDRARRFRDRAGAGRPAARLAAALDALGALALATALAVAAHRPPDALSRLAARLDPGGAFAAGPPAGTPSARVARAVDGDTLVLVDGTVVRILGIDAPETRHPDMDGPQPLGDAAARRLEELVGGRDVVLEADTTPTDHFGRSLRHVWLGRQLVAEALLREGLGHALVIPPNARHADRLRGAEDAARAAGRGVWGLARPTPLAIFGEPVP